MKKFLVLFFVIISVLTPAISENIGEMSLEEHNQHSDQIDAAVAPSEEDDIIAKAIEIVLDHWKNEEYNVEYDLSENGYLEIIRTRVVYLTETAATHETMIDMHCFVEFFLLTDYYGTAPYYNHVGVNECVVMKTDGTFEIAARNPLDLYRARTYNTDFSDLISDISDRGSEFNNVYELLID